MLALNRHSILILIALLCPLLPIHATRENISFQRITINDGLSLSSVYYIYQDSKGFMWFATEDGLNKYDGNNFTIYNHTPGDPGSLSYKWIEKIVEDPGGNLWLASRMGLTRLDPSNDKVIRFFTTGEMEQRLSGDTILTLTIENEYLWIGSTNGLDRLNTETLEITPVNFDSGGSQRVYSVESDEGGRTWVGTNKGLYLINNEHSVAKCLIPQSSDNWQADIKEILVDGDTLWLGTLGGVQKYLIDVENTEQFDSPLLHKNTFSGVNALHKDSRDQLWISTTSGLYRQKEKRLHSVLETPEYDPSLAVSPGKPLIETNDGSIWYGTYGGGVYVMKSPDYKPIRLSFDPTNPKSISDNTILCIYEDRAGGIWIGTFGAGISVYDPGSNLIRTLRNNPYDPHSLNSSFVWSIFETKDSLLWIGTNTKGINIVDPSSQEVEVLEHDPADPSSLQGGSVRTIYQDSRNNIWVGTDDGGLSKYIPENQSFLHFTHDSDDPNTISSNSVRAIFEDSTGILWIGTRNGLNRFNSNTGSFKRFLHDPDNPNSLSNNFVYSAIYMDEQGFLWVGTYGGGLNKLNTKTGKFTNYKFNPEDPASLADNIVFAIYEDEKGYFWIGTNSGLNLFNPSTGKFKRYGTDAGLPNDVIYGIMPDNNNRLWLTTNKGISRLDLTEFRFKNFDVRDGLQSNEFNGGAYHRGYSGKLYAGGVYGLNIIEPGKIKPVSNTAELIINRLEILGKDVKVLGEGMVSDSTEKQYELIESAENYYLPKHVAYLDKIRLNYNQRFFSIEFSALNHHLPEKLNYRYRMSDMEQHWNLAGNRNYVTYANMKPGSYIFEVDASNADGYLTTEPARLKIIITPPFWRSYWFMLLIALIILGIVVFIYRYLLNQRTNNLLKLQYEQIKSAHQKLQLSENNLKELNATKDKFFSIISHDLKNPFTSVLSISELISKDFDSTDPEELKYGVNKIHKTNKHIYNLLENLLTWSKTQRGQLTIDKVKFNLTRIIETNINLLKLSAEKKNISIEDRSEDKLYAYADMEMISTVVRNLLNNAIKFTPPGKNIIISTEKANQSFHVMVQDEGIGLTEEEIVRLFRIDDKFKRDGTDGEKGTGLGLIICKEFIERNGGNIRVESKPGDGSKFIFTLPCSKELIPSS